MALLKLTTPIETSDYVSPICMPSDSSVDFSDKQCVATGWGKVDYSKHARNTVTAN